MPSAADLIPILHGVVLSAFVGVTAVSMLGAVASRMRLRRPLLAWRRSGSFTDLPLGPGFFLLLVAAGFGHAWLTGRSLPPAVLVGYPAGGVFWGVATWVRRTVVVTDYGIVPDQSRGHQAVVWSRIVDYVVTTRRGRVHFVFFFRGAEENHRRLDVSVPRTSASALYEIVERKLGGRFSVSTEKTFGNEALDQLDDQVDLS